MEAQFELPIIHARYFLHQHNGQGSFPCHALHEMVPVVGVVHTVIVNSEGVTRNFYPGDKLPLWHVELEPRNSVLDILNTPGPEPMNI